MALDRNKKKDNKKATATGKSLIPSYTNLIDQVRSAAEAMDRLLKETSIGSPVYAVKMKIVRKNAAVAGEAMVSILDAMSPVIKRNGEIDTLGKIIGSFSDMKSGGFVKFMRGVIGILSDKRLSKDLEKPLTNMKSIMDILKGLPTKDLANITKDISSVAADLRKTVVSSFMVMGLWKNLTKTIEGIAVSIGKGLANIDQKSLIKSKKTTATLLDIVSNLSKFVIKSTLLSLAILPASAIIIPAMAVMKVLIKSVIWATDGLGRIGRKRTMNKINRATRSIIAIGAAFALLTLTLYEVGQAAQAPELLKGMVAFAGLVAMSVGVLFILTLRPVRRRAREGRISIIAIGAAFALLTLTLYGVGQAAQTPEMMEGMKSFALLVGLAVGTLLFVSIVRKRAVLGAVALGVVSLALLGFTAVAKIISGMEMGEDAWKSFGFFTAVVGLGVLAVAAAGFVMTFVVMGAIAIALTAVALTVFMVPVKMISSLGAGEDVWKNFGFFTAVVGLGVGAAVAAGLPGVFLFAMRGSVILLLTASVLTKYASAMQTIASMADVADLEKMKAFVGATDDVMSAMKDSVKKTSIKDIWKIGKLYGAMGDAMLKMAEAYEIMGKIHVDPQALASAVSVMMRGAVDAFIVTASDPQVKAALEEMNDWGVKGFLNNITGKKSAVSKLLALSGKIGKATSGLAKGIRDMASMRVDEGDGKTRSLTAKDFVLASVGVTRIVTAFFNAIGNQSKDSIIQDLLKGKLKRTDAWKVIECSNELGAAIGSLAGGVKEMSTMTFTDENGKKVKVDPNAAGQNIASLITTMYSGFTGIKIDDKLPGHIKKTAESLETLVKATGGLDMSKAEKMKSLLEKINELGKGINWNFKELADVINGKLIDTLDQLKEALEGAGDAFAGKGTDIAPVYTADGNPPAPASGPMKPSNKPGDTGKEIINNEFKDMISSSIDDIKSSLRDLVDASRAGGLGVNIRNVEDLR